MSQNTGRNLQYYQEWEKMHSKYGDFVRTALTSYEQSVEDKADLLSWNTESFPSNIVSWMVKAVHEKDVSAAPTPKALECDSRLVLLAGSIQRAIHRSVLSLQKYGSTDKAAYLGKQLRQALDGQGRQWEYDIIAETLRLKPAVLVAESRETPATGVLMIDEVHVPGNTNVLVPVYNVQRDPRYWLQADEFIPERWGPRRSDFLTGMTSLTST
ncbi:hypothetical protein DHEL01_v210096 [Diaporthe helianthi]|uniref:Uncharacterized protein n=1 Tax=Diaporthe helianthi TaxID=158607 RepID=A0A2P5HMM9_DIAHE|nr:hypothetical protein DHEL01_v210096 [Diaporthe helianthi]